MRTDLKVLDELEQRLIATYYPAGITRQRLVRGLRLRGLLAGSTAVVAGAVAVVFALSSGTSRSLAVAALGRAASAAQTAPLDALTPGTVWYARVITTDELPAPASSGQSFRGPMLLRGVTDVWISSTGTIRLRSTGSFTFASAAERRHYQGSIAPPTPTDTLIRGRGALASPLEPFVPLLSYRALRHLPSSASHLLLVLDRLAQIVAARATSKTATRTTPTSTSTTGAATTVTGTATVVGQCCGTTQVRRNAVRDLTEISWLLTMPVPPKVRVALYHLAAQLPGVRYLGEATDTLGRHGVEVAVGSGEEEFRLIFNPQTGTLLATSVTSGAHASALGFGPYTQTIQIAKVTRATAGMRP